MFKIDRDFAGRQIPGDRPYQEDSQAFACLIDGDDSHVHTLLTVLADGMGGENAGDKASQAVVEAFVNYVYQRFEEPLEEQAERNIPSILADGAAAANQHLAQLILETPDLLGMGTTLLATITTQDSLYWVSIGDSPLLLYSDGVVRKLNADHSMMPLLLEAVENGDLREEDIQTHPERNVLRSAVTGDPLELVDCPSEPQVIKPGDSIIVASDGLDTLDLEAVQLRMKRHESLVADSIADKLLTAVKKEKKPRQDNTSVNIIKVPDPTLSPVGDVMDESKTRLIR
ncbi:MAG: PP2C family protein-serine/threonine phosphatase [Akkermansiaceae bacterium]